MDYLLPILSVAGFFGGLLLGQRRERQPRQRQERPWAGELDLIEGKLDAALEQHLPKSCRDRHAPVRFTTDSCPGCDLRAAQKREDDVEALCERALERGTSKRKLRAALRDIRDL